MKLEDIFTFALIVMLFIIQAQQSAVNKKLQTQIDELRIIVNQKFLPAMIFDKNDFSVR